MRRFSADKLRAAIAASHRVDGQELYVTASVGIAVYPADGTDAETLLQPGGPAPCCAPRLTDAVAASCDGCGDRVPCGVEGLASEAGP